MRVDFRGTLCAPLLRNQDFFDRLTVVPAEAKDAEQHAAQRTSRNCGTKSAHQSLITDVLQVRLPPVRDHLLKPPVGADDSVRPGPCRGPQWPRPDLPTPPRFF
jgi:hypothetical protein